jgi:hypothetical protein
VLLGTALEALHAWKSSAYLGVGQETRRLMWTLAHAHGIGLSLLQLGFAATLGLAFAALSPRIVLASRLLDASAVLIPLGFLLGGVTTYEADPGLGILLVPVGALTLIVAIGCVVVALHARAHPSRVQPAARAPDPVVAPAAKSGEAETHVQ